MAHPAPKTAPQAPSPAERAFAFEEQKRQFLRTVSHELRTPLNSILGFSEILATELYGPLGDPQYKEYAEIIRGSGARLLKMINQVLEIAKLQGGAADLTDTPEPLDTAIDDVVVRLEEDMAERDIRLTVEPAARSAVVLADARGLRTVLSNLLTNAVTFSPDGGEVRISARADAGDWEIAISDAGEGVETADLPRLLKPFEQGENALKRNAGGAGLGLAICDLTCQGMGGSLALSSAPGQGLTARVRLPAA